MTMKYAEAGNFGPKVRSDCWVGLTPKDSGGIELEVTSKVETFYGDDIRRLFKEMLNYFKIENAAVEVKDAGAVPFVLMARMESAIKKAGLGRDRQFLPEWSEEIPHSSRERFRRSRLYLPGDQPKLMLNAAIHNPDGLILDLEDSVPPGKKNDARILVRNALRALDFLGTERMVRINQLPLGLEDLDAIIPQKADCILIPKVESAEQLQQIDARVDELIAKHKITHPVFYMPIIESALGIVNAWPIAAASGRNVALAIGLEDYTADIGVQRTNAGTESFYARSVIVNAARAAGIQPIDTVYSDVSDNEGLRASVLEAKMLGFDGKGCIHPRQIAVINRAFAPEEKELEKAKKIVLAFEDAQKRGLGVVALGSKMIDPPVVKRAQNTIQLALKSGMLNADWRNENDG